MRRGQPLRPETQAQQPLRGESLYGKQSLRTEASPCKPLRSIESLRRSQPLRTEASAAKPLRCRPVIDEDAAEHRSSRFVPTHDTA